jgi:hypothetical protein
MSHLDRIAALLHKAESTDNVHEAEAYLAKAQELATQASVDLAVARARTAKREAREQPTSSTIRIGEPRKRANTHLVSLLLAVGRANGVQMDIAYNSTYVLAYGMPSDLEMVETLFASLATQMTASANTWLAAGEWKGQRYVSREGRYRPHTAQTARAAFYRGFIERIQRRLTQAREAVVAQAETAVVQVADDVARGGHSTGALVLRAKEAEVRDFYRQTSKARGSWGGYSGGWDVGGAATEAGRSAAARARITSSPELPAKGPGLAS